jgi:hypothetical protein
MLVDVVVIAPVAKEKPDWPAIPLGPGIKFADALQVAVYL